MPRQRRFRQERESCYRIRTQKRPLNGIVSESEQKEREREALPLSFMSGVSIITRIAASAILVNERAAVHTYFVSQRGLLIRSRPVFDGGRVMLLVVNVRHRVDKPSLSF